MVNRFEQGAKCVQFNWVDTMTSSLNALQKGFQLHGESSD